MKVFIPIGKPIAFHPLFSKLFGGSDEAIYIQQLLFWSDKGSREDGWIYKTKDEIEEETNISSKKQDRIRKIFEENGILKTDLIKVGGRPVLHYFVDSSALQKIIFDYTEMGESIILRGYNERNMPKRDNPSIQRIPDNTIQAEESAPESASVSISKIIPELIDLFKDINASYKTFFANKTERSASKSLLEVHSFEEIKERLKYVRRYNQVPFLSRYDKIYKPSDLLRNWSVMEDHLVSLKQKVNSNTLEEV